MILVLAALAPIAALIALGWLIRSRHWVEESFWPSAERLTFNLLLPALLIKSLSQARLDGLPVGSILGILASVVLLMAAALSLAATRLAAPPWRLDGPAFTSLFQCSIRPNTYVGLAMGAGLWGGQGIALIALCTAVTIPLVNMLSVIALLRWAGSGDSFRWRSTVLPIARNPLILSCLIGGALNLGHIPVPRVALALLDILGQASLPMALLSVGAGLSLGELRRAGPPVGLAILAKMAVLPLMALAGFGALGVSGIPLAACVVYAALPASPASYVTARQMGGDAPLVATMLSAETVAAVVMLPLWLMLLPAF